MQQQVYDGNVNINHELLKKVLSSYKKQDVTGQFLFNAAVNYVLETGKGTERGFVNQGKYQGQSLIRAAFSLMNDIISQRSEKPGAVDKFLRLCRDDVVMYKDGSLNDSCLNAYQSAMFMNHQK